MKHAKRLVLIPEDTRDRLERNLINTEQNMDDTLRRTDMFDDEKQKLYYANLERYLNLKHQKNNDFPTININSATPDDNKPGEEKEGTARETLSDSVIVDSIPKTMRERATAILNRLKAYPNVISWDNTGQVKLDNKDQIFQIF